MIPRMVTRVLSKSGLQQTKATRYRREAGRSLVIYHDRAWWSRVTSGEETTSMLVIGRTCFWFAELFLREEETSRLVIGCFYNMEFPEDRVEKLTRWTKNILDNQGASSF